MCCVFFFKQKTAYEMRISDWSSDVCSSDLEQVEDRFYRTDDRISRQGAMTAASMQMAMAGAGAGSNGRLAAGVGSQDGRAALSVGYAKALNDRVRKIGRASCRERVCQYV